MPMCINWHTTHASTATPWSIMYVYINILNEACYIITAERLPVVCNMPISMLKYIQTDIHM